MSGEKSVKSSGKAEVQLVDTDSDAYRCGYFSCRPDWLQTFNTPRFLLLCMCWFTFTQGFVVNGVIYTNFTSWQRRYGLSSTQLAWISSSYDITAAVITLVFGYIGQWMHNGRILCFGAFMMSIGSFVMTTPYFASGDYALGETEIDTCDPSGNSTTDCSVTSQSGFYGYLIAAQVFHAFGGSAAYTLGIPYMDDQIKIKNTPLYIGIMQGMAAFGPALGYILGGWLTTFYVDFPKGIEPEILPTDPRWVGAWWIGLLYSGFAALTVAFLIGCYPRELPSGQKNRTDRISQLQPHRGAGEIETRKENFGKSFGDMKTGFRLLCTNPVWFWTTFSGVIESGGVTAFAAFLPKIMQYQFAQPPARAAALAGLIVVPGAAGGQILGGIIARVLKLQMKGLLIQSIVCALAGVLLSLQFLLRCETVPVAGVTHPYFNDSFLPGEGDLINPCNADCNCTTVSYDPICGKEDTIEYFSPCHGGCLDKYTDAYYRTHYDNCTCIPGESQGELGGAIAGICESECAFFGLFLFLFLLINLETFIASTSSQAIGIRCVADKQRPFATALQGTFVRLLGNVPGPIVLGVIFDQACILDQVNCDGSGACWIYDTKYISEYIFWASLVIKSLTALGYGLALLFYKKPKQEEMVADIMMVYDQKHAVDNSAEIQELPGEKKAEVDQTIDTSFDNSVVDSVKNYEENKVKNCGEQNTNDGFPAVYDNVVDTTDEALPSKTESTSL